MKIITNIKNKEFRSKAIYAIRQTIGQAILSAATIGYLVDHLDILKGKVAVLAAAGIVALVLYFANSNKR